MPQESGINITEKNIIKQSFLRFILYQVEEGGEVGENHDGDENPA